MNKPKFGSDPIDQYSKPVGETKTKLARVFTMSVREKPEKPGRSLAINWDQRSPLVEGFKNRYSYTVKLWIKGNLAGNHYHKRKKELFFPVVGDFIILLEDIDTKEDEEIKLCESEHQVIFIPTKVAHTVIAQSDNAVLLVVATYPGTEEDEFPYKLK